uniref:Metalloendopeptidase n=1 Tax=Cyprinus carpio TaxID=7962 RepID=A0A8C1K409_CYPCA
MDPRASLSILLLLAGISLANPVRTLIDSSEGFHKIGQYISNVLKYLVFPKTKNALYCFNNNCFWKKNSNNLVEVPYIVSSEYSSTDISVIKNAMSTFHNKTCIRFSDNILILLSLRCYSYLGRIGGKQVVSFNRQGCVYHGIIQHELNHALGFYHEHTRSDRDKYVKINWEYVPTDKASNFQIQNTNNQNTTYDYGSIMHYGKTAFTTQAGKNTITPIPDATVAIGQRQDMSNLDILRINKLYGCVV